MKSKVAAAALMSVIIVLYAVPVADCRLTSFDDYQFISDTEVQASSWNFDLTIKDPVYSTPADGIILSYKFYEIDPLQSVNYISPVDILVGSGIVAEDPSRFNFEFSWGNRYVNVSFNAPLGDVERVVSSIGNNHLIARTPEALSQILSIEVGDKIRLSGYLVDITGWNTSNSFYWETDLAFGDENCEILVVSDAIPVDVEKEDLYFLLFLISMFAVVVIVVLVLKWRERAACEIRPQRDVGKLLDRRSH